MLCTVSHAFGQVVIGGVDINKEEKVGIVEVLITSRFSSKSVNVYVDYGQRTNFRAENIESKSSDYTIVDPETKKEKLFASTAALLNFMEANNWEHYNSLAIQDRGDSEFYYYFRKKR
jgi:hypothetical protein